MSASTNSTIATVPHGFGCATTLEVPGGFMAHIDDL